VTEAVRARVTPGLATRLPWWLAALAVFGQVAYPLVHGSARAGLTVATVCVFFAAAATHAWVHRGARWAGTLVAVAAGGGALVEVVGVHTGVPFGRYEYGTSLGAQLLGVPVVIPLAWAMMAYPALLAGRRLTGRHRLATPFVAGWALASWDLFLDPQMVAAGHWRWADPTPALPGVPGIPLTNYAGWFAAAVLLMTVLDRLPERPVPDGQPASDGQPALLYLWTYASQVLGNAAFFDRPSVAVAGALGMGCVAIPYGASLLRERR
jgi:carotene biosynthesis associated membrane protein